MSTSTIPDVPYRLEFSVEVPGTPEQVWDAIATARGISAWFGPTDLEEREGGSLRFVMGPEMDSIGRVTRWDAGTFNWIEDSPDRVVVELQGGRLSGRLELASS